MIAVTAAPTSAGSAGSAQITSAGSGHTSDGTGSGTTHDGSHHNASGSNRTGVITGTVVGITLLVAIFSLIWYFYRRYKRRQARDSMSQQLIDSSEKKGDGSYYGTNMTTFSGAARFKMEQFATRFPLLGRRPQRSQSADSQSINSADLQSEESFFEFEPHEIRSKLKARAMTVGHGIRNALRAPRGRNREFDNASAPEIPPGERRRSATHPIISPILSAEPDSMDPSDPTSRNGAADRNKSFFRTSDDFDIPQRPPLVHPSRTSASINPYRDPLPPPVRVGHVRSYSGRSLEGVKRSSWTTQVMGSDTSSVVMLPAVSPRNTHHKATTSDVSTLRSGRRMNRDTQMTTRSDPFDLQTPSMFIDDSTASSIRSSGSDEPIPQIPRQYHNRTSSDVLGFNSRAGARKSNMSGRTEPFQFDLE